MTGASCVPFGRLPSSSARLMSAALQLPRPVSTSGVRLAPFTVKLGSSNVCGPPESCFAMSNTPPGPRGVWQLPQVRMLFTR